MVASVPDETKRTGSTGVRATISSASSTSGAVGVPYDVPRATALGDGGLHLGVGVAEQHRAPRADQVDVLVAVDVGQPGPCAEAMKRGVPPTASKARTGEFTPPGVTARARLEELAGPARSGGPGTRAVTGRSPLHSRRPGQPTHIRQARVIDGDSRCSLGRHGEQRYGRHRGRVTPGDQLVGPCAAGEGAPRVQASSAQWGETST